MAGKKPRKLFILDPVLMPHGNCTENCRLTTDNSYCSCYLAIKVLITFGVDAKATEKVHISRN
jgi:hypothetical protein